MGLEKIAVNIERGGDPTFDCGSEHTATVTITNFAEIERALHFELASWVDEHDWAQGCAFEAVSWDSVIEAGQTIEVPWLLTMSLVPATYPVWVDAYENGVLLRRYPFEDITLMGLPEFVLLFFEPWSETWPVMTLVFSEPWSG